MIFSTQLFKFIYSLYQQWGNSFWFHLKILCLFFYPAEFTLKKNLTGLIGSSFKKLHPTRNAFVYWGSCGINQFERAENTPPHNIDLYLEEGNLLDKTSRPPTTTTIIEDFGPRYIWCAQGPNIIFTGKMCPSF